MLKSSLLEIIRTFSKQELIKFEDFVRSPYFNKKDNVTKLFLEIKKFAPEFASENLGKEIVWDKVFPGMEYNYGIVKNLIFDLNKLAERFIIVTKCESDIESQSKFLLEYLHENNLPKLFINKFDSIERSYDINYFISSNYSINLYYNFSEVMAVLRTKVMNYTKKNDSKSKDNFSLSSISNFLINSFKMYQNLVVDNSDINKNYDDNPTANFLKQISPESFSLILENVKKISEEDHFYLDLYYKMYCMFFDTGGESYLCFKKQLFDNSSILAKTDLRDLHFCLISAIDQISDPEINHPKEKLSVFDSMISLNILTEPQGNLSEGIFIYYVSLAFTSFDINRINAFSEKFVNKLDEEIRYNSIKYIKALNFFVDRKYEESLNEISQIDPNYFIMKLYLRYIKGRCLYKMKDYELFLNEYDALKHFIKNNDKLNSRLKIKLEKFYYFLNLLFKLREDYSDYEFSKLKNEATDFYKHEWNWIIVEIENFENKRVKD